ncbi:MAG: class I SAM-dependent methyltransferase [Anaerolineae bacterium]
MYDVDPHVAELYDRQMVETRDVGLLQRLIGPRKALRILEPFCGTGRVLVPLVQEGHTVVGLDRAGEMLARAQAKVSALSSEAQHRATLRRVDVLQAPWPQGFDVVILGSNCLYELATSEGQAQVIAAAAEALRPGGYLFVDNDHMEGGLDRAWYDPPVCEGVFPTGECADGVRLESRWEVIWYDVPRRLIRFRRQTLAGWLVKQGMMIERRLGDYTGAPYAEDAPRAVFWARKGLPFGEGTSA